MSGLLVPKPHAQNDGRKKERTGQNGGCKTAAAKKNGRGKLRLQNDGRKKNGRLQNGGRFSAQNDLVLR